MFFGALRTGLPAYLVPRSSLVVAIGQALHLLPTVVVGEDGYHRLLAKSCCAFLVDHGAPEKSCQSRRGPGLSASAPVHQVGAHGVAPVHRPPDSVVRIVLVEEMVLARIIDEAVGVIHPPLRRREVVLRAIRFVGCRFAPPHVSDAPTFQLHADKTRPPRINAITKGECSRHRRGSHRDGKGFLIMRSLS